MMLLCALLALLFVGNADAQDAGDDVAVIADDEASSSSNSTTEERLILPKSVGDCSTKRGGNNKWSFIDEEYKENKNQLGYDTYMMQNVQECWRYMANPKKYLNEYNDKTPYHPEMRYDCDIRNTVRRMNFSSGRSPFVKDDSHVSPNAGTVI
jgi:hypothetical protein